MEYYLSVVIPVYNEEKRISKTINKLIAYFSQQTYSREIILVDDGSSDDGVSLAQHQLEGHETYRIVRYGANRGKGYALKQGILASQGQYVLFSDADLSTPLESLDRLLPLAEQGAALVHGSRKMAGAQVQRHQPWLRENMGRVFTALSNLLLVPGISDVTCGFKLYHGQVARMLYQAQALPDWSFDAEIIFLAHKWGYPIKEVPVFWHDEKGTKVHLVRDSWQSLLGLLKIRWNDWRGYYPALPPIPANLAQTTPIETLNIKL